MLCNIQVAELAKSFGENVAELAKSFGASREEVSAALRAFHATISGSFYYQIISAWQSSKTSIVYPSEFGTSCLGHIR